jgi:hypothetical protein
MGLLNKIFGSNATIQQLPAGTVTVDRQGNIITTTVASTFPRPLLQAIACDVLELFREARTGQMPLAEVNLHFISLRITARELRGGAIIFLSPQTALPSTSTLKPARP